jgi:hypothetical protein
MLKSLTLRHFKSFRECATVPLAPLTLIYGGNSGGKSTIIQTIMLLKQTLDSAAAPGSALIFGSDAYLDLGNFQNIVSDHDISQDVTLSLAVDNRPTMQMRNLIKPLREFLADARLSFTFGMVGRDAPRLNAVELFVEDGAPPVATYAISKEQPTRDQLLRILGPRLRRLRSNSYSSEASFLELSSLDLNSGLIDAAFLQFMDTMTETRQSLSVSGNFDFASLEAESMEEGELDRLRVRFAEREQRSQWWLSRLENYTIADFRDDFLDLSKSSLLALDRFLPNVRLTRPSRRDFLSLNQLVAGDRGPLINRPIFDLAFFLTTIGFGLEDEFERLTYVGPLREFPERNYIFSAGGEKSVGLRGENLPGILFSSLAHIKELNRLADLMQLGYEVSVHRSSDSELDNVFAVRLTDQLTKARVGISDVGFGVSQILPILLQCALRPRGCIVMEQPEIHLNPKLQASLAEVFASAVTNGDQQLIIETHSEHLLLRLQRLIREGKFDAKNLSVIYVSKTERGSAIMPISIGQDGDRLTPWPDGFFDDTYRELFEGSVG